MLTLLCVPIMVNDEASALADAALAKSLGADLVEFRVDEFFSGINSTDDLDHAAAREQLAVVRLVSASPLPCIATCRPTWEGGHYDGDEMARVSLYERLGTASGRDEHPPRYLDIELAAYTRSANLKQKINLAVNHPEQRRDLVSSLILSMHDFQGRPADLSRRVLAMKAEPAAKVLKVAFRARSIRDNLELFELLRDRDRPMIALGMGDFGLMSRVLAPKFGAFLTFASLRESSGTAPGQPTIAELLGTYRFRSIGPKTKVFGIVGWPVSHSMSPTVHNAGFAAVGFDGVYVPMPVAVGEKQTDATTAAPTTTDLAASGSYESFKATLGELVDEPTLDFTGCSVTMPHKENLVRLARERGWSLDEASSVIGAANTLHVTRDQTGKVLAARVFNTDSPALASCILSALKIARGGSFDPDRKLRDVQVAIVGAGGVGRAAAYATAALGASVVIFNRSLDRAATLATLLNNEEHVRDQGGNAVAAEWSLLAKARCEVFVQCTSVGMKGGPDPEGSPVTIDTLVREVEAQRSSEKFRTIALETVYAPLQTLFLRDAHAAGWVTVDGASMFVEQAALQFEAWTRNAAPKKLFEKLVRERLR